MAEMKNIPALRFKGFNDEWIHDILKNIAPLRGGFAFKSDCFIKEGIPIVRISNILANGRIGGEFEFYKEQHSDGNYLLSNGDVLIAMSGATTGKTATLHQSGNIKYYQNQRVGCFMRVPQRSYIFVSALIKTMFFQEQLKNVLVSGAQPNVSSRDIDGFSFVIPVSSTEQECIGSFFQNIDSLLEKEESKLERIKTLKTALFSKMFPAHGKKIPALRFKGFNDEWEKKTYGDLGNHISGGALSYDDVKEDGKFNCVLYGQLYTDYDVIIGEIKYHTDKKGNTILKGDILFPQSTTVDALSLISPACLNVEMAETSGVFVVRPYDDVDGNFVTYYTKGNFEQRAKVAKKAQGLTIIHLYYQSIKDESIMIPSLQEQQDLSAFFQKLDKLISLQVQKIKKLQNLKKSFLAKMFA